VTAAAVDLLRPLDGKNQGTLGAIKQTMFAPPCMRLPRRALGDILDVASLLPGGVK